MSFINEVKEPRDSMITSESKHHAAIASEGEQAAMPDADDDQREQYDCAIFAEDVEKDL